MAQAKRTISRMKRNGLVINLFKVVKPGEAAEYPQWMLKAEALSRSIEPMEVVYLDDLLMIKKEFENMASYLSYHVMSVNGNVERIESMDSRELWNQFKGYLRYSSDRMDMSRVVYLGNMLSELEYRLRETECREG